MPSPKVPAAPRAPQQIIDEQRGGIDRLRQDLRRSEAERQRLRRENEKLKDELEAARRAGTRQAAPFSRGTRVARAKRAGRKPGARYGRRPVRVATQHQEELPVPRPMAWPTTVRGSPL